MADKKTPPRPKPRPMKSEEELALERGERAAKREAYDQKTLTKKKTGGQVCRGMGKATRGGKYGKMG